MQINFKFISKNKLILDQTLGQCSKNIRKGELKYILLKKKMTSFIHSSASEKH